MRFTLLFLRFHFFYLCVCFQSKYFKALNGEMALTGKIMLGCGCKFTSVQIVRATKSN